MEGRQEQRLEGSKWVCRMAHGLTLPAERPSCRALRTISPNVVRSHSGLGSGILWPAGRAACTAAGFFLFSGQNLYQARMTQWRRQWHPTPLLLPGKSHGRRSLVGCSPWGHWESDTTKRLHFHFSLSHIGEGNGNPLQCSYLENPRDGGAWWAAVYGVAHSRTRLK